MGYVLCIRVQYSKGSGMVCNTAGKNVVMGGGAWSWVLWGGVQGAAVAAAAHCTAHHGRTDGGECAGIPTAACTVFKILKKCCAYVYFSEWLICTKSRGYLKVNISIKHFHFESPSLWRHVSVIIDPQQRRAEVDVQIFVLFYPWNVTGGTEQRSPLGCWSMEMTAW